MHLLITGATGLLGLNLSLLAVDQGHRVTGLSRTRDLSGQPFSLVKIDLVETEAVLQKIGDISPDAIIHCAALANLNAAEEAPELAQTINAVVPGELAGYAARNGIPFLHISTDAVFDGREGGYEEMDKPNPLSVYAQTKLAGEIAVQQANPDACIARVVFYGWSLSGRRSLSEFFFNELRNGNVISGFTDTFFCPLYVEDLAWILLEMLDEGLSGHYHVVSPESISKYEFGLRLARIFGFDENLIQPVQMQTLRREAPRSLNLTLSPAKLEADLSYPLPDIDSGIERMYRRWQDGYPEFLQHLAASS
ncbi:MAG: SDR family oxidoreductase [Brevefilum sp.]